MRSLALILLSLGTIAASIALAPIARMTRLFEQDLGAIAPLIRLLRPLVTWGLLRRSPYLEQNRRAARRGPKR